MADEKKKDAIDKKDEEPSFLESHAELSRGGPSQGVACWRHWRRNRCGLVCRQEGSLPSAVRLDNVPSVDSLHGGA